MPLTIRTNGSGGSNIITASWFNDYHDLLTGAMQDQEVTIKNLLILNAIGGSPGTAPTLALAAGTNLGVGLYKYAVTFGNADGETLQGPTATITTTTGNTNVVVSAIPTGPTGTTRRYIYRTTVGGTAFFRDNTLNDNSTTSYTDSTTDASLTSGGGTSAPLLPTFGGSLFLRDSGGSTRLQLSSDGTVNANPNPTVINGSVAGTASFFAPFWGPGFKLASIKIVGYNSASNALFTFPGGLARGLYIIGDMGGATPSGQFQNNGSVAGTMIITGLASGGGTASSQTTFHHNSLGTIRSTLNQIQLGSTGGTVVDSAIFIVGV